MPTYYEWANIGIVEGEPVVRITERYWDIQGTKTWVKTYHGHKGVITDPYSFVAWKRAGCMNGSSVFNLDVVITKDGDKWTKEEYDDNGLQIAVVTYSGQRLHMGSIVGNSWNSR